MRNKWESFDAAQKDAREEDRIATQYAREFLKEQSVDAAIVTQKAAEFLRQLEQVRATLAATYARQQQKAHAVESAPEQKTLSTQEIIASIVPLEVVSRENNTTCAA